MRIRVNNGSVTFTVRSAFSMENGFDLEIRFVLGGHVAADVAQFAVKLLQRVVGEFEGPAFFLIADRPLLPLFFLAIFHGVGVGRADGSGVTTVVAVVDVAVY